MSRSKFTNLRCTFFARNLLRLLVPGSILRARLETTLGRLVDRDVAHVLHRLAHYNRVEGAFDLDAAADRWRWSAFRKQRNYCFDMIEHLRHFDPRLRLRYRFGDETSVPMIPTIVKARPIEGDNRNSVLFKLNKIRHFRVVRDRRPFAQKRDQVMWRGKGLQPHRRAFLAACHGDPWCDVGSTDEREAAGPWRKPRLTIEEQLEAKFILSVEGNDVATNLKWIFSSNSVCVMRRPKFESWFMESTLVPDHHYLHVADDYSDLADKVRFYARRPDLAERIVHNAQAHSALFRDERRERAISLLVLLKYFVDSGQMPANLLESALAGGGRSPAAPLGPGSRLRSDRFARPAPRSQTTCPGPSRSVRA
ncbi:MAG: glycosyl transferase family 90 [Planctomycetota bacterium]|nr:glycosyl transferase family 90 [Planctomycetota bacterium]